MVSAAGIVAIAVIIYCVIRDVRRYWALRKFKGPPLCGFTRYWMFKAGTSGQLQHHYKDWNDRYGPTCRIGPTFLLTKDIAVIKQINAVRSDYSRGDWFKAARMHPTQDNITSYMDDKVHTKVRQALAPGYSGKDNPHLEQDIDAALLKLVDLIQAKYLSTSTKYVQFDLARATSYFTLDALAAVAFGRSFGFLDKDDDPFGYMQQTKVFWPLFQYMATFTELHHLLRIPFIRKLWPSANDAQGLGAIMHFAQAIVGERFGPDKVDRQDMLGSFIAHGGQLLTKAHLEAETLIQISAGSDSTATAIRTALLHITTNPRVVAALRRELDAAVRAGTASRPIIRDHEARRLPYLQACIKETLRIMPPAAGLLPKRVPAGGDTIGGVFVPAGTDVGWDILSLMRDASIFGADVALFRPERWLLADSATLACMLEAQGAVFGAGKYSCLGRHVASFELDKAVAELVLRFEWELPDVTAPWRSLCMGFFLQEDMFFRVTVREEDGDGVAEMVMVEDGKENAWGGGTHEKQQDFGLDTKWEDV